MHWASVNSPRGFALDILETDPSTDCPAENLARRNGTQLLGSSGPNCCNLIRLSADLFSGTLSRQSLLQSALLPWLQVVGVTLYFLNDVFRLNLALEPTEGIL